MKFKKIVVILTLGLVAIAVGGCSGAPVDHKDTGKVQKVTVTYNNGKVERYKNAIIGVFNYSGSHSSCIVEVRHDGMITLIPNNAKVDIEK